jgi:hypothetical protein
VDEILITDLPVVRLPPLSNELMAEGDVSGHLYNGTHKGRMRNKAQSLRRK